MTLARQIELLQHLFASDAWNELLLPQAKAASEVLFAQIKESTNPNEILSYAGQAKGLNYIIYLPLMKEHLETQLAQETEKPAGSTPADNS